MVQLMKTRRILLFSALVMISAVVLISSCKKETQVEQPKAFDPGIDGIAVRSVPEISPEMAQRIIREGPLSPFADATDESVLELASKPSTPESITTGGGTPLEGTGTGTGSSDPNSFF